MPLAPFRPATPVLYLLTIARACLERLSAFFERPSAFLTSFVGDGAPKAGIANETATTSARAAITTFLFTTVPFQRPCISGRSPVLADLLVAPCGPFLLGAPPRGNEPSGPFGVDLGQRPRRVGYVLFGATGWRLCASRGPARRG